MSEEGVRKWVEMMTPELLRPKLISASLFIMAYELLETSIKGRIKDYYTPGFSEKTEEWAKYESEVLALDPEGKKHPLRSSIAWLRKWGAIAEADEAKFVEIKDARNDVAHELAEMVGGSKMQRWLNYFGDTFNLMQKVDTWWIVNHEIPMNPDFDGQEIDPEGIASGRMRIMQMLLDVALGTDGRERQYLDEYEKHFGKAK